MRLKGGDPFIFGRGSEEAAALAAAGIDFEVVPGVTAAVAAGEYAGLSFTHRDYASAVAFVTGHEDPAKEHPALDYAVIARFPGTLVFYMGLHRLESLVDALVARRQAGHDAGLHRRLGDQPGAADRRRTRSASLPRPSAAARLHPPSIIVVGECVNRREAIAWFEKRPLFGRRIGITRPAAQAGPVDRTRAGAWGRAGLAPHDPNPAPRRLGAGRRRPRTADEFDWLVFTSVNGVESLLGRLWETGGDARRLGS